jgi:hypothetical protein
VTQRCTGCGAGCRSRRYRRAQWRCRDGSVDFRTRRHGHGRDEFGGRDEFENDRVVAEANEGNTRAVRQLVALGGGHVYRHAV